MSIEEIYRYCKEPLRCGKIEITGGFDSLEDIDARRLGFLRLGGLEEIEAEFAPVMIVGSAADTASTVDQRLQDLFGDEAGMRSSGVGGRKKGGKQKTPLHKFTSQNITEKMSDANDEILDYCPRGSGEPNSDDSLDDNIADSDDDIDEFDGGVGEPDNLINEQLVDSAQPTDTKSFIVEANTFMDILGETGDDTHVEGSGGDMDISRYLLE